MTLKKFIVCGKNPREEISQLVDVSKFEKKFGGDLEDKKDNFFPPDLN